MGVPEPAPRADARQRIRSRHGIPDDAVVFTAFGKITPEKRVREAMRALPAIAEHTPNAHLLLAGEAVEYYDMAREASRAGIDERRHDRGVCRRRRDRRLSRRVGRLPVHAVADVARDVGVVAAMPGRGEADDLHGPGAHGRRPDAGSAQLVAAGTIDRPATASRCGVSIDILDEDHSLKLAMRRLGTDEKLRATLGANARALWANDSGSNDMVAGYQEAIASALLRAERPGAARNLPAHLRADGTEHAESLVKEIPVRSTICAMPIEQKGSAEELARLKHGARRGRSPLQRRPHEARRRDSEAARPSASAPPATMSSRSRR